MPVRLELVSEFLRPLQAVEAELARLEQERTLLMAQRERLLDGTWGKGAPPCEELPQLGELRTSDIAPDISLTAIEADEQTVQNLRAHLDMGWQRVMDWKNQNPFGVPRRDKEDEQ